MRSQIHQSLRKLLVPLVASQSERRSLINGAFPGSHIRNRIHYDGTANDFANHLINVCVDFGDVELGRPAIIALLDEMRTYVGPDKQIEIGGLIKELQQTPPLTPDNVPSSPPPTPTFDWQRWLIPVGAVVLVGLVGMWALPAFSPGPTPDATAPLATIPVSAAPTNPSATRTAPPATQTSAATLTANNHFDAARAHYDAGEYAEAIADYDLGLATEPDNLNALYYQEVAYRNLPEPDIEAAFANNQRMVDILEARPLDPESGNDALYYSRLGYTLRDTGDDEAALAHFTATIERYPTRSTGYFGRATIYTGLGRCQQAIDDLNAALERGSSPGNTHWRLGYRYLEPDCNDPQAAAQSFRLAADAYLGEEDKDYENAISMLNALVELEPDNRDAWADLHIAYYGIGDFQASAEAGEQVLALEIMPIAHSNLANAYRKLAEEAQEVGNDVEAARLFGLSADNESQAADLYTQQANETDDDDQAANLNISAANNYADAARMYVQQADSYTEEADAERKAEALENARVAYTNAINREPDSAGRYNARGVFYSFELKDYETALPDLTRAIELNREFANAFYHRGMTYRWLDDCEAAIDDFTRSIELNTGQIHLDFYYRGLCHETLGDLQLAKSDFEEARIIAPSNDNVQEALVRVEGALAQTPTP